MNAHAYGKHNIMVIHVPPPGSHELEKQKDAEVIAKVMKVMRSMFGTDLPEPIETRVTRWGSDPYSRGAYSYIALGTGVGLAKDLGAAEWGNRLQFAGEAASIAGHQCVHGAMETGIKAARTIMDILCKKFQPVTSKSSRKSSKSKKTGGSKSKSKGNGNGKPSSSSSSSQSQGSAKAASMATPIYKSTDLSNPLALLSQGLKSPGTSTLSTRHKSIKSNKKSGNNNTSQISMKNSPSANMLLSGNNNVNNPAGGLPSTPKRRPGRPRKVHDTVPVPLVSPGNVLGLGNPLLSQLKPLMAAGQLGAGSAGQSSLFNPNVNVSVNPQTSLLLQAGVNVALPPSAAMGSSNGSAAYSSPSVFGNNSPRTGVPSVILPAGPAIHSAVPLPLPLPLPATTDTKTGNNNNSIGARRGGRVKKALTPYEPEPTPPRASVSITGRGRKAAKKGPGRPKKIPDASVPSAAAAAQSSTGNKRGRVAPSEAITVAESPGGKRSRPRSERKRKPVVFPGCEDEEQMSDGDESPPPPKKQATEKKVKGGKKRGRQAKSN